LAIYATVGDILTVCCSWSREISTNQTGLRFFTSNCWLM